MVDVDESDNHLRHKRVKDRNPFTMLMELKLIFSININSIDIEAYFNISGGATKLKSIIIEAYFNFKKMIFFFKC